MEFNSKTCKPRKITVVCQNVCRFAENTRHRTWNRKVQKSAVYFDTNKPKLMYLHSSDTEAKARVSIGTNEIGLRDSGIQKQQCIRFWLSLWRSCELTFEGFVSQNIVIAWLCFPEFSARVDLRAGSTKLQDMNAGFDWQVTFSVFPATDISNIAMQWTPVGGARKRGRPKKTWRRTFQEDLRRVHVSWDEAKTLASDRSSWRKATA